MSPTRVSSSASKKRGIKKVSSLSHVNQRTLLLIMSYGVVFFGSSLQLSDIIGCIKLCYVEKKIMGGAVTSLNEREL